MKISLWPRIWGYRLAFWLQDRGFYEGERLEAWDEGYNEGFEDGTDAATGLNYSDIFNKGHEQGLELGKMIGKAERQKGDEDGFY